MKAKFCLPIIKASRQDVLEEIKNNMQKFDMFEIWIGNLNDPFEDIKNLVKDLSQGLENRLIVTFKKKNGAITMNGAERKKLLRFLSNKKVLVDLDMEKQKEDLTFIKSEDLNVQTIISFHDFKKTPRTSVLVKIIQEMGIFNPSIYKIATFCETEKQAIALLHLLLDLKEQKKKCIILSMGKLGQITRIFGSIMGNEIIFAPNNIDEQSAPGQLTKQQLDNIFSIIDK